MRLSAARLRQEVAFCSKTSLIRCRLPEPFDAPVRVAVFGIGPILPPPGFPAWTRGAESGFWTAGADAPSHRTLLAHKCRAWALEHPEGSEMPLGNLSMEEFASSNDAAVVVLARPAAHYDPKLTNFEQDMLKKVTGAFSRVVLVLAAPGYMELTQEARSCSAIVLLGLAGQEAGYALADVLTGRSAVRLSCRSAGRSCWNRSGLPRSSWTASSATAILTPSAASFFPVRLWLGLRQGGVQLGQRRARRLRSNRERDRRKYRRNVPVQGSCGSTTPARTAEKQVLPGSSTRSRKRRSLPRANSRRCICASR